jgi:hypothetical protein
VLRRLAKWVLESDLADYEFDLAAQREHIQRVEYENVELRAAGQALRAERDEALVLHSREVRNRLDEVRTRLERALLNRWADLSVELDVQPTGDGDEVCTKIPLHNRAEVTQLIAKIRRDTGYPEDLEGYRCDVCPRHPLAGRVRHVRHAVGQLDQRGLTSSQRAELRAREPLTQPLAPELLDRLREKVRSQSDDYERRHP